MANQFDPANAPSTEPTEFTVGDYVQWKRVDFSVIIRLHLTPFNT